MKILELFYKEKGNNVQDKPYIIAEAGVNHEGNLDLAKRLIDEASEGGAHAIKFQTYKAETIASINSPSYWDLSEEPTTSQYELFKKYDKFWKNEFEELKKYCDLADIEFMSTPFDLESANFLNDLMDVYKISSSDITNRPFIEYLCQFNKPIILSTGASFFYEIQEAVDWVDSKGISLALLHCVLNYPTSDENANLGVIKSLQQKFSGKIIGYSDHTLPQGMENLEVATLLGAKIIEKHFTYDKTLQGNDHYHSMDKDDLKGFTKRLDHIFSIVGNTNKLNLENEYPARNNARRSLVAATNIKKGEVFSDKNLTWKRPASGISPRFINEVKGKTASFDVNQDDIVTWSMVVEE